MSHEERLSVLSQLADGSITFRDLAGLKKRDVEAIAYLGRVAMETQRYEQAATIFEGLAALEADRPEYLLFLAYAFAEGGKADEAIEAVDRYFEHDEPKPPEDLVRALLLHAQVIMPKDPQAAELDIQGAKLFADKSEAARKVFEEMGR